FLFFAIVPVATIALHRLGSQADERLRARLAWRSDVEGLQDLVSLLFVAPFFLAPFLYLTTFKWGWPVLIPLALSQLAPRAVIALQEHRWLRRLFAPELRPAHALILTEALAWILFRYVATGKRIAHIPTLFLEAVFILFFLTLFWLAFLLIARLASFVRGVDHERVLQRLAIAGLPMIVLPVLGILFVSPSIAIGSVMGAVTIGMLIAVSGERAPSPRFIRNVVAYAAFPLLLYCASYASTASLVQWIDLFHRGESLGPASDYLRGKVPYRDVFVLHGLMLDGQLDAWLMQLLGRDAAIAIARPVVLGSFAVPALWYLGMAVFDSIPLALLAVLLGAVTTTDNERAFFEIASAALLIAGLRSKRAAAFLGSGVFAALALFFSFDIGLYCLGGAAITLLILRRWRALAAFAGGFLIGAAPFIAYLATRGALGAFFETSFVILPRIIDAVWSLPFPDLTRVFRRDLSLRTISEFFLYEPFRFVLNPLVIGIAILVLLRHVILSRGDGEGSPRKSREILRFAQDDTRYVALLALTAFAALTQRSAVGRADFPHQYFSAFLIGPIILILLLFLARGARRIWATGDRSAQAFVVLAAAALFPLLFAALWVPDIINIRIDDTLHYQGRVSRIGFRDPEAEEVRNRIDSMRYHVFELTRPGQPIFDFSNQPAFYFYCDRPNPTRFYQVPILSPPAFQREAIVELERAKPPLVIRRSPQQFDIFDNVDNTTRAQALAAYIDAHYAYARSVRGVELWTRKQPEARFELASYMRRIRMPSEKELEVTGGRTRLVFPSVGSLPGANQTYWRSDLVLHNPMKQQMPLALRYVTGDLKIDRRFTLGGGRSIRWEDVVRSLFSAPESRGVLWIEYRGERGPVARVKTYDTAHEAKASLESPLSMRDAATAGSDAPDLTLVGIPGGGQQLRRVNLGVVNVGAIPASFRITVHTRDGARVGRKVELGLPEDESFLLNDAETELRAALDENATVHVELIAGTCVAYASVVGAGGDNQFIPAVPSPTP
ncbi:MAG TPA: hypothetical protein VJ276_14035, partial [Thermoanaerobaculia bacterium]|nr:hypothetical protein [Thermoanaerobaculia bacterium]